MRTRIAILAVVLVASCAMGQTRVVWSVRQTTGSPQNREITVTSLDGARKVGTNVVYPMSLTISARGGVASTNLYAGNYRIEVQGLAGYTEGYIPDTNVVVYWSERMAVRPGAALASDFYTKGQVDAALRATLLSAGGVVVNVKAAPFNAIGNGTSDDWEAVQKAVTHAGTNASLSGVRTVYFPPGTYRLTNTVVVVPSGSRGAGAAGGYAPSKSTVELSGAGMAVSVLQFAVTNGIGVNASGGAEAFMGVKVSDLGIWGPGSAVLMDAGVNSVGVVVGTGANNGSQDLRVSRVMFYGWGTGLAVSNLWGGDIEQCTFLANKYYGALNSQAHAISYRECHFNGSHGEPYWTGSGLAFLGVEDNMAWGDNALAENCRFFSCTNAIENGELNLTVMNANVEGCARQLYMWASITDYMAGQASQSMHHPSTTWIGGVWGLNCGLGNTGWVPAFAPGSFEVDRWCSQNLTIMNSGGNACDAGGQEEINILVDQQRDISALHTAMTPPTIIIPPKILPADSTVTASWTTLLDGTNTTDSLRDYGLKPIWSRTVQSGDWYFSEATSTGQPVVAGFQYPFRNSLYMDNTVWPKNLSIAVPHGLGTMALISEWTVLTTNTVPFYWGITWTGESVQGGNSVLTQGDLLSRFSSPAGTNALIYRMTNYWTDTDAGLRHSRWRICSNTSGNAGNTNGLWILGVRVFSKELK